MQSFQQILLQVDVAGNGQESLTKKGIPLLPLFHRMGSPACSAPVSHLAYRLLLAPSSPIALGPRILETIRLRHSQLPQKWICNWWRPVGAAAASHILVSSTNQDYPHFCSLPYPPPPTPSHSVPKSTGTFSSWPRCGIGFHFPTPALRRSYGDKAGRGCPMLTLSWGVI